MKIPFYDLNDEDFEGIVASVCEEIFGMATIIFSPGKDGGKDAKFTGTANYFPSESSPWSGKIIIQAKHTTKVNASCSDSDFSTIIKNEIPKIITLRDNNHIDYYVLFTNRKLSGLNELESLIVKETKVPAVLLGVERIQKYIQDHPAISRKHKLGSLLLPLDFNQDELVEIVETFSKADFSNPIIKTSIEKIDEEIKKIPIEKKNILNELSKEYFENEFKMSFNHFKKIKHFLSAPENDCLREMYEDTVAEISEKVTIQRSEFVFFEEMFPFLYDYVIVYSGNRKGRRYIRYFLHYMYYMCHIGKS